MSDQRDVVGKWTIEVDVLLCETGVHVRRGQIRILQRDGVEPVVLDVPGRDLRSGGWEEQGIADVLKDTAKLLRIMPIDDLMTEARERAREAKEAADAG